ncbi:MAG: phosphoribosyltransferase family protein [Candidatus Syntrophopropionicum ammoniitolerans]
MAEEVGYRLQLPVNHKLLVKDFDTQPQVGLDRVAREKNLEGAFRVTNTGVIQGKNIMIIDDVFTTGNTMSSVAMVVRSAGAGNIFGLTVAAGRYF